MADAQIKTETGIKPEPGASPPPHDEEEDEMLEDAGDLEFYDKQAPSNAYGSVYLARIPKYLWEAWDHIDEDEEIQIGTMRYWVQDNQPHMQLLLDSNRPEHRALPKEYSFEITAADVNNTYIFTEQELPGFAAKSKARAEAAAAGIPAALLNRQQPPQPGDSKPEKPRYEKGRRWQPYYRKADPKKTRIFGKVQYEISGQPLQNEEAMALLRARAEQATKPKSEVKLWVSEMRKHTVRPGSQRANNWGAGFTAAPVKPKAKKQEHLKAARIPRDQLLDLLFQCFKEFQYWPIRALRQRLDQPEAYLRQTLDDIAILNKAGRFANTYSLKPEYSVLHQATHAGDTAHVAPQQDDDDDDDDDEEEMEDVV